MVWNRVLPYAEMKKVTDAMLKSVCGDSHYWNSVTNVCTECPVGSLSTGSGFIYCPSNSFFAITKCICQKEGYFWNVETNTCELSLELINNKINNNQMVENIINTEINFQMSNIFNIINTQASIIADVRDDINNQILNITSVVAVARNDINNQISNITANIKKDIANITNVIRDDINNQISNITSEINNQISNITANINKINTMNQKLSATLTKLRKTTSRKKKTDEL